MNLNQFNRILLQTLLLPVFALLCVSAILVWQILAAQRTVARIQVADQNIATTNLIAALIADEQTGVRAYQNTANEIFLQPYEFALQPLQQNLLTLRQGLISQQSDTSPTRALESLDALDQAHQRWLTTIAIPMINMVRSGGETRDPAINLRGKAYMDSIHDSENAILEQQHAQRTTLADRWQQQLNHTLQAVVGSALVLGLLIGAFAYTRLHLVSAAYQATLDEQRRTQQALLATEKLAVAGRLAASIAHEIHNPLDAVVNLLYLLKQGGTPEERDEFIDLAQGELSRVTQISRAMLGMYREARTPVALDIAEILRSVLILLDHPLTQAAVSVHLEVDTVAVAVGAALPQAAVSIHPGLAPNAIATGFPVELRQVFTNLLTNAIDASAPNTTIHIRVHPASAPDSDPSAGPPPGVIISIRDHGPGIPLANLDRLFQPFFTTKGENGTGLGLWVSQGIVQKHGGTLTVTTSTDPSTHGTTMTVFLPRGAAELPSPS